MPDFKDSKHRPHAIHTGEEPRNPVTYGPESLSVTLDAWGPERALFTTMYDALQSNWGDAPSRTVNRDVKGQVSISDLVTGWALLNEDERAYVESCFAGKTLPQVKEMISFSFCIDGIARAATHQIVRSRIGAGFMQHGGRDNDWRHRPFTITENMRRAFKALGAVTLAGGDIEETNYPELVDGLKHCVKDFRPLETVIDQFVDTDLVNPDAPDPMTGLLDGYLAMGRAIYAAMVDAGIPWEDARRVLWMGTQTYIHAQYTYPALEGVLANRLEHVMDWEINCIAQLMLREIKMKCPPLLSKYLGSASDKAGVAKFAGLESWPPDGKYPNPYEVCGVCGYKQDENMQHDHPNGHRYFPKDSLTRQHRPEQNPFWVLHPDSMSGGPIVWVPTDGTYPTHFEPITVEVK